MRYAYFRTANIDVSVKCLRNLHKQKQNSNQHWSW